MSILAGCGFGGPNGSNSRGAAKSKSLSSAKSGIPGDARFSPKSPGKGIVADTKPYVSPGADAGQQQRILKLLATVRSAQLKALRSAPVNGKVLGVSVPALMEYDAFVESHRAAATETARAAIGQRAEMSLRHAIGAITQASKDPWTDPDQDLQQRLDLLKREYQNGTFGWRDYNDARVQAIVRAYGAGLELRMTSLQIVYQEAGISWQDYNKHRMAVLTYSYGTPLQIRLEWLAKIQREGGISWVDFNASRVRMILGAHDEAIDTRLAYLEEVYRDGGISWQAYNQHRVDLIATAFGDPVEKRIQLLRRVYEEGGTSWQNFNQTRVQMILDSRYEALELRLRLLEQVYQDGGISFAAYQQYRKQLISQS